MSSNPFALSAIQSQQPEDTQQDNPFSLRSIEKSQGVALREKLNEAATWNPDSAAEAARLAKRYPAPTDTVYRNLDSVKRRAAVDDAQAALADAPNLAARMRENPDLARQAHDDVGVLSEISQAIRNIGSAALSGLQRGSEGVLGAVQAPFDIGAQAIDPLVGTILPANPLRATAQGLSAWRQRIKVMAEGNMPKGDGNLEQGFYSGISSLSTNLAALPLAMLNPAAGLTAMVAPVGGQGYGQARDQGVAPLLAAQFGMSQAAIEYATEKIPVQRLIGDVRAGTGIVKTLIKQMALEVPGEQVATVFQDLNEWALLPENADKTFADYLAARPDAAIQTLVATVVGTGGNVAVVRGIDAAMRRLEGQDKGIADGEALKEALRIAGQSKLLERNPEAFREALDAMAGDAEVRFDARTLLEQSSPDALVKALPSLADQMAEAQASGGEVRVPVSEFIAGVVGTPLEQSLREHARLGENEMSQAEAKDAASKAEQFLQQEADRVIQQAQDQAAMRQSQEVVKQGVLDQLNTVGRFSPQVNEAYATFSAAFFATMAGRMGITPEEMAAKYPLRILGQTPGAPGSQTEVMDQANAAEIAQLEAQARALTVQIRERSKAERAKGLDQISDETLALNRADADRAYEIMRRVDELKRPPVKVAEPKKAPRWFNDMADAQRAAVESLPEWNGDDGFDLRRGGESAEDDIYTSAESNFTDSEVVPGVRSVPLSALGDLGGYDDAREKARIAALVDRMREDRQITPIFVGVDESGQMFIMEGQHRARAFQALGMQSIPAKIVVDFSDGRYEQGQQTPRGTFNPRTLELALNPNADLSTFLHESGHFFLEVMSDLASQPNAPAGVVEDMGVLLKWFGITGDESVGGADSGVPLGQRAPKKLYRGEASAEDRAKRAGGAAWSVLGRGIYTTRDKKFAAKFGKVVEVSPDEAWPTNPLVIENAAGGADAAVWNWIREQGLFTGRRSEFDAQNPDIGDFIQSLGYDGIVVGDEVVRYRKGGADGPEVLKQGDKPTGAAQPVTPKRTPLETWQSMTLDQKRPYHERFAESIEQYLMEGKAPSLDLQPVFHRFRSWLLRVYKSVKEFLAGRGVVGEGGETLGQIPAPAGALKGPDGQPLKLYHGTGSAFEKFARIDGGNAYGPGYYFTTDPAEASRYADGTGGGRIRPEGNAGPNVIPVYIRADKVFELDNRVLTKSEITKLEAASNKVTPGAWKRGELAKLFDAAYRPTARNVMQTIAMQAGGSNTELAQAAGYDALRGDYGYVVFDPKHIVSAISGEVLGQGGQTPGANIQLSDEVRQVFDRMLASEEQIRQAEEVAGMLPDETATADAIDKLTARSLRDMKWLANARSKAIKALQRQAAALRKEVLAEVTAEVNAMPEFLAKEMLAKTRKENGAELNDTERAIIADAFGFPDVDTMLKAIDAVGKKADVIEGMTDQRMLERHGDLIDQRAIEEAANAAVHNDARAKVLATELKAQADLLGTRADTGQTNAAGKPITVNALQRAAQLFAENVVARTPLKNLKRAAWDHTSAERRAAKAWQEATASGKTQEAVQAKQDQVLNNAAAKAALDAQQEVVKIRDFFARIVKGNDEKTVERGRDPDVVNAARAILTAYGVQSPASKNALAYLETVKANDPAMYAAIEPAVSAALLNPRPLDTLTIGELRALRDELDSLWHLAKRSRQMEVDGNLLDLDDAVAELQTRLQDVPPVIPGELSAMTPKEQAGRMLQFAVAITRRVEAWAEALDGKYGGPFTRLVFGPVKAAADRYRSDRIEYRRKFVALLDNVSPTMRRGLIEAPELGYVFGKGHNGVGMAELLHAVLHTGNASNKRKLLLGRGWATELTDGTLDTTKWDAFLKRMTDTGVMTKVHYDFAQGVWDLLEGTKALAQKAHRDVFGRYFAEVTAEPFDTPFGSYRGGYVPAQADTRIVTDAALRDLANQENENMAFAFPTTNKGFTKARVEYNRPLVLDLRTIAQHLDKVLLFSHMEPAVRDVRKALMAKGVSQPLSRIQPAAYEGMLTPWMNRAAKQIVETPVLGDGKIGRIASAVRARAGMALMFGNVSNTLQQITGLSSALVKVSAGSMMNATATYIAGPKKMAERVATASPYMAERIQNEVSIINETMNEILLDPSVYERAQVWTQKHAYFLQSAFDNVISPIVWTGAYNDALKQGMTEPDAVKFADSTVRQTQGSTMPEDVSRIETGPAFVRLFSQFIGYFNMVANTNATALMNIAGEVGLKKGAGRALGVVFAGLLMPIWVAEFIAQAMRGGPDDEDKDGWWIDDWLAAVFGFGTIKGIAGAIPGAGQVGQLIVNRFNDQPADDRMSLSPAVSVIESAAGAPASVYKAIVDDASKQKAVRDVASLVTVATGLPASFVARSVGYAAGVADERIEPTGPIDAARGVISGVASPESKQR